uniref:Uncharacterized protein n=1 Tax=Vespula pensylvanica TaxID=30213 RepID=A0A834NQG9_VESPE|nr:hypothetical protein H0235_012244 [Vespula pensylvanica]
MPSLSIRFCSGVDESKLSRCHGQEGARIVDVGKNICHVTATRETFQRELVNSLASTLVVIYWYYHEFSENFKIDFRSDEWTYDFLRRFDHCFVRNELLLIRKYSLPCKLELEWLEHDSAYWFNNDFHQNTDIISYIEKRRIYRRFWFDVSIANIKADIDVPLQSRSIHVAPFVTERGVEFGLSSELLVVTGGRSVPSSSRIRLTKLLAIHHVENEHI